MNPIFTRVSGNEMTYGLYDRIAHKFLHWLDWHLERRSERLWAKAQDVTIKS